MGRVSVLKYLLSGACGHQWPRPVMTSLTELSSMVELLEYHIDVGAINGGALEYPFGVGCRPIIVPKVRD
jgi:hypothetical protein